MVEAHREGTQAEWGWRLIFNEVLPLGGKAKGPLITLRLGDLTG